MLKSKRNWLLAGLGVFVLGLMALFWGASRIAAKYEPFIKRQVIAFLEKEFDSQVELGELTVAVPKLSPVQVYFRKGRGVIAAVTGKNLVLRYQGRTDIPPLFSVKAMHFSFDLAALLETPGLIPLVILEGMEINIPPKGQRPTRSENSAPSKPPGAFDLRQYMIGKVVINQGKLVMIPKSADRFPLEFAIHNLELDHAGLGQAMRYTTKLRNPKPPGEISSQGSFGPWNTDSPSDTPLAGKYTLTDADLSVFKAIGGTLQSTGEFTGTLSSLAVQGEANVPDFRLKMSGNPVPLRTKFSAEVDGTNGNTTLKPVQAVLGKTAFTTAGAVLRHEVKRRRSIQLNVVMPKGNLQDLLRLAVKGKERPMVGQIAMRSTIEIPPDEGKVAGKLILHGDFTIEKGQFREDAQDKVDELSRRAQGRPGNLEIDNVFSRMKGSFHMEDREITVRGLSFAVPGADVNLDGSYDTGTDELDFQGTLRLKAKVSQTLTGWKRWLAKPIDPFFAKNGAGTYLPISISGSSHEPKFGLARNKKKDEKKKDSKGDF